MIEGRNESAASFWMRLGAKHWPDTFGAGLVQHSEIWDHFHRIAPRFTADAAANAASASYAGLTYLFSVCWAQAAYPKLVTSHKFAAALMCTASDESMLEDVRIPWKAFVVSVPNGLLKLEDQEQEFDSIGVLVEPEGDSVFHAPGQGPILVRFVMLLAGQGGSLCRVTVAADIGTGLFGEIVDTDLILSSGAIVEADRKARLLVCARRLVVGLLVSLLPP